MIECLRLCQFLIRPLVLENDPAKRSKYYLEQLQPCCSRALCYLLVFFQTFHTVLYLLYPFCCRTAMQNEETCRTAACHKFKGDVSRINSHHATCLTDILKVEDVHLSFEFRQITSSMFRFLQLCFGHGHHFRLESTSTLYLKYELNTGQKHKCKKKS